MGTEQRVVKQNELVKMLHLFPANINTSVGLCMYGCVSTDRGVSSNYIRR